jgi:hypothetical protein
MDDSDLCKGCRSNQFKDCMFSAFSSACPCIKCLVKVTCAMACKNYDIFEGNYYNKYKVWKKRGNK